ncbi:type III polyketide synthase [Sphingomonas cavernae]|uniref:type III polyketide synthase n=1 Tax=Sphingomonas cavernae TaxID=2320861 RepID=UPI001EE5C5B0|nr:type III polyketide synthase [Sphingomonas cavernae]
MLIDAAPPAACVNAIATAVPGRDIHQAFVDWAEPRLPPRERKLFRRMVERSDIAHRWSVHARSPVGAGGFYENGAQPTTSSRMQLYAEAAPALALDAISRLDFDPATISHLIVASCTGFVAPGVDQIIAARIGLSPSVERLLIGFMGCYAAVTALRSARHIVRSDRRARVLVVTVELSTLHLAAEDRIEPLLAMLQFGDGASAALVSADPRGFVLGDGFAQTLPDSAQLIGWTIGDQGFLMHLSGEVPGRIGAALGDPDMRAALTGGTGVETVAHWAVHAGGRSILDAVEHGLGLAPHSLEDSRAVLRACGNMSSATLMFVLARMLEHGITGPGVALAFGPGLAAEGLRFGPVA